MPSSIYNKKPPQIICGGFCCKYLSFLLFCKPGRICRSLFRGCLLCRRRVYKRLLGCHFCWLCIGYSITEFFCSTVSCLQQGGSGCKLSSSIRFLHPCWGEIGDRKCHRSLIILAAVLVLPRRHIQLHRLIHLSIPFQLWTNRTQITNSIHIKVSCQVVFEK